jgi:hypothetical protein
MEGIRGISVSETHLGDSTESVSLESIIYISHKPALVDTAVV